MKKISNKTINDFYFVGVNSLERWDLSKLSIEEKLEKIDGTTLGKALEACRNGEKMVMAWVG